MPTVPPTYIALDNGQDDILPVVDVLPEAQRTPGSPTPDPDLDDGVLVSVVTGDGVGAVTQPSGTAAALKDATCPEEAFKPHLCLSNLSLHSPSVIIGTPFDVSPRFEYPFPMPSSTQHEIKVPMPSPSLHPSMSSPFVPVSAFAHCSISLGTISSLPQPRGKRPDRSHSPTHPKHVPKDAPIPPGLISKKKNSMGAVPELSSTHQRKRSRSAMAEREREKEQARTSPKVAKTQPRRSSSGDRPPEDRQVLISEQDRGTVQTVSLTDSSGESHHPAQSSPTHSTLHEAHQNTKSHEDQNALSVCDEAVAISTR